MRARLIFRWIFLARCFKKEKAAASTKSLLPAAPTLHRQFAEIVRLVCAASYRFGFVSNGSNFSHHYALLIEHREWLDGVTFSLDGARETTHDRLRGKGSYRQAMRAASICMFKEIPFTLNMVLTAENRSELREMIELGASLGSRAVRFGHLMSTPETALRGLDLSPKERLEVEDEIWRLKGPAPILVAMAPGYFSESPLFPCAPLKLQELNLDRRGNVRSVASYPVIPEPTTKPISWATSVKSAWPRRLSVHAGWSLYIWRTSKQS